MVKLNNIYFGENNIHKSQIKYASLDTYLDYIYLGQTDYYIFVAHLLNISTDFECTSYYHCHSNSHTCEYYKDMLPDFVF